jgi:multidrug resistance efflux pump
VALASTLACGGGSGGPQGRGAASGVAVQTTGVQRMSIQRQIDLAGTLFSPDQAKVSAEASGVVRRVLVEIGRDVSVGTPLVEIEPRELKLALDRAEAALLQTRAQLGMSGTIDGTDAPPPDADIPGVKTATANLDDARAGYERAKALSARGVTSKEVLQAAETRFKVAEAAHASALDSARATKAQLQDRRASCTNRRLRSGSATFSAGSTLMATRRSRWVSRAL